MKTSPGEGRSDTTSIQGGSLAARPALAAGDIYDVFGRCHMTGKSVLAGLAAVTALACGGGGSDSGLPTGNNGGGGDISIGNNFFNPSSFSVAPNSTVTWTWNSGGVMHNVTFDDGQHSDTQGTGTYQRTFTVAGSFPYHCT